jgi:hypothetical protein
MNENNNNDNLPKVGINHRKELYLAPDNFERNENVLYDICFESENRHGGNIHNNRCNENIEFLMFDWRIIPDEDRNRGIITTIVLPYCVKHYSMLFEKYNKISPNNLITITTETDDVLEIMDKIHLS